MWLAIADAGTYHVYTLWIYDPTYGWMPVIVALFFALGIIYIIRTVMSIFFG